jgi:hypothetical protein
MLDASRIPEEWKNALSRLKSVGFPEAIIGGGALRDLDHGVEIKDVDIFVRAKTNTEELLHKVFGDTGRRIVNEDAVRYLQFTDDVVEVWEFETAGLPPFQVIVSQPASEESPEEFLVLQLHRFDLGLCRIAFDGEFIFTDEVYEEDAEAKVLRIRDPRRIPRSLLRAERIQRKYPGYKIIAPDGREYVPDQFDFAEAA